MIYTVFGTMFRALLVASGVQSAVVPRIHHLRDPFAVHTLIRWYQEGADVGALLPRLSTYLGHVTPAYTYWYLSAAPELLAFAAARLEQAGGGAPMTLLAPTMQLFFTERLTKQHQASPATVRSYRNAFRLLLRFMQVRTGKAPSKLDWDDPDVVTISAFLDHLEADRHNGPRSRNARLAAIRSLFHYAALRHPEHAQLIAQVLALPKKRFHKTNVTFLEPDEVDALLVAPDLNRWEGRRNRAMLVLAA